MDGHRLRRDATPVPNLVLAGAHTKTAADVWSIEGAVESGRRAARVIEPGVAVCPQHEPWWLRGINAVDDLLFARGLPNVFDLFLYGVLTIILAAAVVGILR